MYGKSKLGKAITVFLMVCVGGSLLYGLAYAINRTTGSNTFAGEGIRIGTGPNDDTIHVFQGRGLWIDNDSLVVLLGRGLAFDGDSAIVNAGDGLDFNANALKVLTGWGTKIDNDSVVSDVAELDDYFVTISTVQQITAVKGFSDTLRLGTNDADGILSIFSEQGGIDYKVVVKPHATMTQDVVLVLPPDDGGASTFLKSDGSGNLTWDTPPGGDPGSAIHDSLNTHWTIFTTSGAEIHDSLNANWSTWLDGDASEADIHDSLNAHWTAFTAGEDGSEADIHDSIYANTAGYATNSEIHDSLWIQDFWSPTNYDVDTVTETGFEIFYPIEIRGTPSHSNVARFCNNTGSDDKMGSVNWNGRLPGGFLADVDSFNIGFVTTDTDTLISKVNIAIYAMNDREGWPPEDTVKFSGNSYASTVADTWRWISIAAGDISPIAALSKVIIRVEATADDGEMVQVEGPDQMGFWAFRK